MNYNIKGTGLRITDEIRTYIEKRLSHADKFVGKDSTALCDIELQYKAPEGGKKYRAEFTLAVRDQIFRAESLGETLHEAIDVASDEVRLEVRSNKKKRLHLVRRGAIRIKDFVRGFRNRF